MEEERKNSNGSARGESSGDKETSAINVFHSHHHHKPPLVSSSPLLASLPSSLSNGVGGLSLALGTQSPLNTPPAATLSPWGASRIPSSRPSSLTMLPMMHHSQEDTDFPSLSMAAAAASPTTTPTKSFHGKSPHGKSPMKKGGPKMTPHPPPVPWILNPTPPLTGFNYFDRLPNELIVRILSNLESAQLSLAAATCVRLWRVVSDDTCWRSAFQVYFKCLPLRKTTEDTWRANYLHRVAFLKSFKRAKRTIQFDPKVGTIHSSFLVDINDARMYTGSLERGVISVCNPVTGKVEKDSIYASIDAVSMRISALLVAKNRIAVGNVNGSVSQITQFRDKNNYSISLFQGGFHEGLVTQLSWVPQAPDWTVSGGQDGNIRIWSASSMLCCFAGQGIGSAITCLAVTPGPKKADRKIDLDDLDSQLPHRRSGYIVAGTESGSVLVWRVPADTPLPPVTSTSSLAKPIDDHPESPAPYSPVNISLLWKFQPSLSSISSIPIVKIEVDHSGLSSCIIVHSKGSRDSDSHVSRWSLVSGCQNGSFFSSPDKLIPSVISCVKWDASVGTLTTRNSTLLIGGTSAGQIVVWDVPQQTEDSTFNHLLQPLKIFSNHASSIGSSISLIEFDSQKIISAAEDGRILVWDLSSGKLIKVLRPGPIPDTPIIPVTVLWLGLSHIVAGIGETIKCWDFSNPMYALNQNSSLSAKKKRASGLQKSTSHRRSHDSSPKLYAAMDLKEDLRINRAEREYERRVSEQQHKLFERFNGPDFVHKLPGAGLTEEEMVQYAMMISAEEGSARHGSFTRSPRTPVGSRSIPIIRTSMDIHRSSGGSDPLSPFMLTPNAQSRQNSYRSQRISHDWPSDDDDEDGVDASARDPDQAEYYSRNRSDAGAWDLYEAEMNAGRKFLLSGGGGSVGGGASRWRDDGGSSGHHSESGRGSYPISAKTSPALHGNSKLVVAKRPSEEEELQYVLELSLKDQ